MHEMTHLLFSSVGRHVGVLDEGVAIHFGQELVADGWRGKSCNYWAKKYKNEGLLPELRKVFTPSSFYMHKWSVVGGIYYPTACSFTSYLIGKYGLEKFMKLFSMITVNNQDSIDEINKLFIKIFGKQIDEIETSWIKSL